MTALAIQTDHDRVSATWKELGYTIRPTGFRVFVRTDPVAPKTQSGLLFLPPKLHTFYGEMPHLHLVTGTVLSVSSKVTDGVRVGDRVCFMRLHFGRVTSALEDGTYVGWLELNQLAGHYED